MGHGVALFSTRPISAITWSHCVGGASMRIRLKVVAVVPVAALTAAVSAGSTVAVAAADPGNGNGAPPKPKPLEKQVNESAEEHANPGAPGIAKKAPPDGGED